MEGTTKSGFKFIIDKERLFDDMEFLDYMSQIDENGYAIPRIINIMFDPDGKKALYEHCRVDGRVSVQKVGAELNDIITSLSEAPETKN